MARYIIQGGRKLQGKIAISGNKNSVLPCLAATLLTDEEIILKNVPRITDVDIFIQILKNLGGRVDYLDHTLKVKMSRLRTHILPENLVSKLRASVLFAGPILARMNKVELSHPGGDVIGRRSINVHLEGLAQLGFKFKQSDCHYSGTKVNNVHRQHEIFLDEASVTATENLILAAALGNSSVVIKNCAKEPHVLDLCQMLRAMGAEIENCNNSAIKVTGVKRLKGTEFTISSDFVEFGTYAIAAAITKGVIEIGNILSTDLKPVTHFLQKMGLIFQPNKGTIKVRAEKILAIPKIHTNIWPGFPTDMMSPLIVLATQAEGVSLCHDWMYESRMFFVDKLISMGAHITIADPHRVLVYGPTQLYGRNLESPDIRAGVALVLAALIASGQSIINRAELIERGYEDIVGKLVSLGASIKREE